VLCMTELWIIYLQIREGHAVAINAGRSCVRFSIFLWKFSLTYSFRPLCPLIIWQKCLPVMFPGGIRGRCVLLTNLSPSCAKYLEIWDPQIPWIVRACPGQFRDCFTFYKLVRLYRKFQLPLLVKELFFLQVNFHVHSSPQWFLY